MDRTNAERQARWRERQKTKRTDAGSEELALAKRRIMELERDLARAPRPPTPPPLHNGEDTQSRQAIVDKLAPLIDEMATDGGKHIARAHHTAMYCSVYLARMLAQWVETGVMPDAPKTLALTRRSKRTREAWYRRHVEGRSVSGDVLYSPAGIDPPDEC